MMKSPLISFAAVLLAASLLGGCGSGSDGATTSAQDAAFKSGAKPTVTMPDGANKPPTNFKSSLDTGGGPRVPAGATPGAAPTGG